ncbi:type I-E CRISPR-associated endoribonuclease Cas2 [Amycolatopsis sp. GM8]|uniref:type I-E CRISPR-associated endoribonuclease Cas2 n=1 Tax=Amycolatopsis sp. GM8 TaxID=2896530 RepID=UPI001F18C8AF|nr:type I-E CRISPR-associated endoribonuclease Cas2 [Amycolatopsis sp. GM8]
MLEASPGVFVGTINQRVRALMWMRVFDTVKTGRAIMVYHASNEQGLAFRRCSPCKRGDSSQGGDLVIVIIRLPLSSRRA